MKGWEQYIKDVKDGKIVVCKLIWQSIERFERFLSRDDIYLDEDAVDTCISFISQMKHFKASAAGKPFILQNWQQFLITNIIGLKYKKDGRNVCNEAYISLSRKGGKDALLAALCLYQLLLTGEASPEIVIAANSTRQADICFEYIDKFGKSIDSKGKILKYYRRSLKVPSTNGLCEVISSDPSRADGRNLSCFVLDEFHEAKDRKMYDVLKSSMGMRKNPLGVIITTAGFNLDGPCHDMYELGVQIMAGVKEMDNFFFFCWQLDDEDDFADEKNWIKCQPNLNVTVTADFMREEVRKAKVDSTALTGVLTKTFNRWVQSKVSWIPQNIIANLMKPIDLEDFRGNNVILGCDLSTVSDFSSLTVFIPPDDGFYRYKTWTYIPYETYKNHPNKALYEKFVNEGSMILTNGNVIDYDFILQQIHDINQICPVAAIYMDKWNATSMQISLTDAGYNVQEFSQSVGNYNACTKEFERLAREGKVILDKSANILWQFGNVFLKGDINGNVKPSKESANNKIDSVISITTALGGYLKEPVSNDFDLFIL